MAFPSVATVVADVESIYTIFSTFKTKEGTRAGVSVLNELVGILNRLCRVKEDFTVTDATDATLTAFFASSGEGAAVVLGDAFRVNGTGDTTDNALATAKGSAVAANDVFIRSAAAAVVYLGSWASGAEPFDFDGEMESDFVSIGS